MSSTNSNKLDERTIQACIFHYANACGIELLLSNYTPPKWGECDMFGVTDRNHGVEFEIKTSRADFAKDASKTVEGLPGTKHELLADKRSEFGPRRFFFVAPTGLLTIADIPDWAGWIEVSSIYRRPKIRKQAPPRSNAQPVCEATQNKIRRGMYWRYWNLRVKFAREGVDLGEFEEADTGWLEEVNKKAISNGQQG